MGPAFIRLNIIAILLLLLGSHPVWAAEGFVTIDSHDALHDYCHDQNFKVSGQLSLQSDNEPSRIEKNSDFCDGRKASLKPQSTLPMCRSTHAVLYYRIDGGEEKYLKKVQSYYLSDWTQVGKTLNYSITVKTDQLQPGPHTLSVIFKDAFGVSCYRYKYGWGYQSTHIGDTIDQATISFTVPDPETGSCQPLNVPSKPKNLGESTSSSSSGSGSSGSGSGGGSGFGGLGGSGNGFGGGGLGGSAASQGGGGGESAGGEDAPDSGEDISEEVAEETNPRAGEPINFCTGNYYTKETDVQLPGHGLNLAFTRFYNSQDHTGSILGLGWKGSYSEKLDKQGQTIVLKEPDGREVHFNAQGHETFVCETGQVRTIEVFADGYRLIEPDGRTLIFDPQGRLMRITDRNGSSQILTYDQGLLSRVDDSFGRTLAFEYGPEGRLQTLATPTGSYTYAYDQGNLVSVTSPGGFSRQYAYQDPEDPHNLTGVINENKVLFTTIEYDGQDRAVSSSYPDELFKVSIEYGDDPLTRIVTDSIGRKTRYKLQYDHGIGKVVAAQGSGGGTSPTPVGAEYTLNQRQQVTERRTPHGSSTIYAYDDRGNLVALTEANGTDIQRTTRFSYHPEWSLVTRVSRKSVAGPGNATTEFAYDHKGNLIQEARTGFGPDGQATRTISYAYNPKGQLILVDGPRSDVQDMTTLDYYPNEASQGLDRGRLRSITDPLGHTTTLSSYNAFGKPQKITGPNGVSTSLTFDATGRPGLRPHGPPPISGCHGRDNRADL